MDAITIDIAGFFIRITFTSQKPNKWHYGKEKLKKEITEYCKSFIRKNEKGKSIDFYISFIDNPHIESASVKGSKKHYIFSYETKKENKIVSFYTISIFHFQYILRSILNKLLSNDTGHVLHASSVMINNAAYIFIGKQGAGKSTIVKLLSNTATPLTDDTVVIKQTATNVCFYQTPFVEKNWIVKENSSYPVQGIYFLRKSKEFNIEKITNKKYVLKRLVAQTFINNETYDNQIQALTKLIDIFNNFYFLSFDKDKKKLIALLKRSNYSN